MWYIAIFFLLGVCAKDFTGHRLISITARTNADLEFLNSLSESGTFEELDFWTELSLHHPVEIRVSPNDFEKLQQSLYDVGLTFIVLNHNIQDTIDDERIAMAKVPKNANGCDVTSTYCTFAEISAWLDEKDADPRVQVSVTATSSFEGRPIFIVKVAADMNNPKEAVWIEAGTHAREWIAVSSALNLIERLSDTQDTFANDMLANFDFYIVPVHNPDGYVYSHTSNRLWRKNRQTCTGIGSGVGTDLNRNWGAGFGGAGTSAFCSSDTYRGSAAFSAPETAALRDAAFGANSPYIRAFFSVHCYSEFMLVPYGYTSTKPARYTHLVEVADAMMAYLETVDNRYYLVGTPPDILYAASGGAYDYFYIEGVPYAYTYELRPQSGTSNGFVISPSNIPTAAEELFISLWAFATYDNLNYD